MTDIAQVRVNNTEYNFADDTKVPYDLLQDTVGWTSKNLIPFPYAESSKTNNGITFTVNSDGSIVANGTATGNATLILRRNVDGLSLPAGSYTLTGCPSGGSGSKYGLIANFFENNVEEDLLDYGNGHTLTYSSDISLGASGNVFIRIFSGTTVNNLTFYPMLCKADIMDDTYEPYNPSVKQVFRNNKIIEGKNLIPFPYKNSSSATIQGVTFTVSEDGTITVNGTNNGSGTAWYSFHNAINNLSNGDYIFSGCPSGGSNTTYKMSLTTTEGRQDTGNGVSVTVNNGTVTSVSIGIGAGYTANNLVFKPMLRKAAETDPTYEQYYIPGVVSQEAQNVLGAKNLLGNPNNEVTPDSGTGLTHTINSDNTITVNGTLVGSDWVYMYAFRTDAKHILPAGVYTLTGCPRGGSGSTYCIQYGYTKNNSYYQEGIETGNGYTFILTQDTNIDIRILIKNGQTVSNLTFKPMIRLASIKDATYVPYAMTNKELTELVLTKKISDIDLDNLITFGTYYATGNLTNGPGPNYGYIQVINGNVYGDNFIKQIFHPQADSDRFFIRLRDNSNVWGSWYKFTGTVVS